MENTLTITSGNTVILIHDSLTEEQKKQNVSRFAKCAYSALVQQMRQKGKKDEAV